MLYMFICYICFMYKRKYIYKYIYQRKVKAEKEVR